MDFEEKLKKGARNRKEQLMQQCEKLHKRNQDVMFISDILYPKKNGML